MKISKRKNKEEMDVIIELIQSQKQNISISTLKAIHFPANKQHLRFGFIQF